MRQTKVRKHKRNGKMVKSHKRKLKGKVKKKAWLDDDEDFEEIDVPTSWMGGGAILPRDKSGSSVAVDRRSRSSHNLHRVDYDPERHDPSLFKSAMVRKEGFFNDKPDPSFEEELEEYSRQKRERRELELNVGNLMSPEQRREVEELKFDQNFFGDEDD